MLSQSIVSERLASLLWVNDRIEHIVQFELSWKDVHHDVHCMVWTIRVGISVQNI